jgi:hypothetical protein
VEVSALSKAHSGTIVIEDQHGTRLT